MGIHPQKKVWLLPLYRMSSDHHSEMICWSGVFDFQIVRRHILGSIIDSERSYLESLKRILEVKTCTSFFMVIYARAFISTSKRQSTYDTGSAWLIHNWINWVSPK